MLLKKALAKTHKDLPRFSKYQFEPSNCFHNFCFVVFCDGKTDVVRCLKCGTEKDVPCSLEEGYA